LLGSAKLQPFASSKEGKQKSKISNVLEDFGHGETEGAVGGGGEKAESISDAVQDNVHLAAPGDLLLASRIKELEQDIETIKKQESIVEALIRKAERQGRQNELRILKKSKSALRREILGMEYQKTQYEVQEEENMILPVSDNDDTVLPFCLRSFTTSEQVLWCQLGSVNNQHHILHCRL